MYKKLFTRGLFTLVLCAITILGTQNLNAQCTNSNLYPSNAITVHPGGDLTVIHNCNYLEEYSNVTGLVAGETYEFTVAGYITVYQDGTLLGLGDSPLSVTAATASDVEAHWNVDAACTTAGSCEGTTVECTSCIPIPPPANDDICGAIAIPVDGSVVVGDNTSATDSPEATPGCASYGGGDVWFSITVPDGGEFTVEGSTVTFVDGGAEIYSSSDNTCTGTLELIECNDDGGPGNQPAITLSGMTPGDVLFFRYWEYGGELEGAFGVSATAPCGTPMNISHTLEGPARCSITWDEVPGALRYDVHYRISGGGPTDWIRSGALFNSRSLHYLAPNTVYDYIVRATCDGTWDFATASAIRRFDTGNTPAAETRGNLFAEDVLNISPNPARESIHVDYAVSSASDVTISVVDMMGKIVYNRQLANVEGSQSEIIDVSSFGQGYYMLVLQSGEDRMVKKFATIR